MYIGFYPYTTCLNVVSISCFCIWMCFGKIGFPFGKSKFWKIRILVFGKISITQKWFKKFEICVEIFHTCLIFKVLY